jgi:sulfopyruvate decarboxylase alpha subunit
MTTSAEFLQRMKFHGFDFYTGVPDSTFKELLALIEHDPDVPYLPAVSEDVAIGVAVGAQLGGSKPVVVMQNSGLGVSINAFASLALLYRIPLLVLIGWRGYRGNDAPEHLIMGACLPDLLDDIGLPYLVLEESREMEGLDAAHATLSAGQIPTALLLRPGLLK